MSGYRRVNYYELCRLCTSSEGSKMNIFLEDGRRRQLQTKIQNYLPVQVLEEDSLPKTVCLECVRKLESFIEFREGVVSAESMLESFFNSIRYSEDFIKEGKVYVKSTIKEEKPTIPEEQQMDDEPINIIEKIVPTTTSAQVITDQAQSQPQQVLVSNVNTGNVQIISGARVQQYKCAMQMQSGNVAAAANQQTFTTVQATPEVLLSLGFKDAVAAQIVRDDGKDLKDLIKSEDTLSRTSISQISEFLRIRSGSDQPALVTVSPQAISQAPQRQQVICRECGKTFSSINQMTGHDCTAVLLNEVRELNGAVVAPNGVKEDNANVSQFSCDVCSKPFKRKEHLFQHRKLHTGERPYVCTSCSKAFSRKEHLVRHLVSHTGQKMHECEVCGKSFSRKDNLHKHRKTHGMSGPYICETCGKSFVVKHYYLMHMTTHAPTLGNGNNASVIEIQAADQQQGDAFSSSHFQGNVSQYQ
ncbi:hypothetical protein QAD02_018089 [Eretmocerus hayati]|uniref:Uncharacterized protein n=1 Tax=Eretmocerus hayati TaxID=131215 RepID=A0ACC2PG29_9HYME|nr:hypothetical protein QAD02_018089 [Eretmocerus hayati]